jgi:hypothetical protein
MNRGKCCRDAGADETKIINQSNHPDNRFGVKFRVKCMELLLPDKTLSGFRIKYYMVNIHLSPNLCQCCGGKIEKIIIICFYKIINLLYKCSFS